jgi:hypothetical protein
MRLITTMNLCPFGVRSVWGQLSGSHHVSRPTAGSE